MIRVTRCIRPALYLCVLYVMINKSTNEKKPTHLLYFFSVIVGIQSHCDRIVRIDWKPVTKYSPTQSILWRFVRNHFFLQEGNVLGFISY